MAAVHEAAAASEGVTCMARCTPHGLARTTQGQHPGQDPV
ncbi:hypothetical protein HaLaN_03332 [Haematococcus lacustris]|uniref:Uncharacterized protein n=1 Tax=Haematococcus lacustris TaxID=44745 RepID=A0A699YZ35_HAELA|nr:hypothetical protein HaLaN_03332 [Haematococcus lacustris]